MIKNSLKIAKVISQHHSGRICGRLRLQKTIHILKHNGFDFDERFEYLHHGPYSYALHDETQRLVSWDILDERKTAQGEYVYTMEDEGRELLDAYPDLLSGARLPPDVAINSLEDHEPGVLELLSTYYYLLESGRSKKRAWEELQELKPRRIKYKDKALELDKELRKICQEEAAGN